MAILKYICYLKVDGKWLMTVVNKEPENIPDAKVLCIDAMQTSRFQKLLSFFSVNTESPQVRSLRKKLCTLINGTG